VRTRRRSRVPDHGASHERWLVSYADFITLLFAFFTVLYASSTLDDKKLALVGGSMQAVFAVPPPMDSVANLEPGSGLLPPMPDLPQDLSRIKSLLTQDLTVEIADGRVSLEQDVRGLVISIRETGSFATGSADLPPEARTLFSTLGARLRGIPHAVRVEGHTDDLPIHTPRYHSNWQLSTARATEVVAFFVQESKIDPKRLSAAGYAEFHPRAANDSAENRARNRRVDLVILNAATRDAEEPANR
jgi:chemotaxis protein MotB